MCVYLELTNQCKSSIVKIETLVLNGNGTASVSSWHGKSEEYPTGEISDSYSDRMETFLLFWQRSLTRTLPSAKVKCCKERKQVNRILPLSKHPSIK